MQATAKKGKRTSADEERLGLRINPGLKTRIERVTQQLKEVAREEGRPAGKISQKSVVEDGLNFYFDYVEGKRARSA